MLRRAACERRPVSHPVSPQSQVLFLACATVLAARRSHFQVHAQAIGQAGVWLAGWTGSPVAFDLVQGCGGIFGKRRFVPPNMPPFVPGCKSERPETKKPRLAGLLAVFVDLVGSPKTYPWRSERDSNPR